MKITFRYILCFAISCLVLSVKAAPIISLSNQGVVDSAVAGVTKIDFNNGCGYASCAGDYAIVSGNLSGKYAQPYGTNSPYLSVPNPSPSVKTATFGLGEGANYFGLFWGSMDWYNGISFYAGSTQIASYSGTDIVGQFANGNQISLNSNRYINFDFESVVFDRVALSSSNFAFESDNHAYRKASLVQEPMTIALMGLGLLGLFATRRFQRK